MERDLRQLLAARRADGRGRPRPRGDLLERAVAEVAGEDDVDDVPGRRGVGRADRLADRDRALEREIVARARPPPRARACSARTSVSPPLTPPPGRSQYSRPPFSCRQSRILPPRASSADTRILGSITRARGSEAAHAALAVVELVDLDDLELGDRQDHELRDALARHRRRTSRRRSVLRSTTFTSPR